MHTAATLAILPLAERIEFFSFPPVISTVREYINAVLTTENLPEHLRNIKGAPAWQFRWIHAVLGNVSEQQEVLDASDFVNLAEELGDRFWYSALESDSLLEAARLMGEDFSCPFERALSDDLTEAYRSTCTMTRADAKTADLSKRVLVYTKKPTIAALTLAAYDSVAATRIIADKHGFRYTAIMQANINKLYQRQLDALKKSVQIGDMNRDLPAERSVLERSLGVTKN